MISLLFPCLFLIYLLILFVAAVIIESETTWDKRDFERSQSGSTSWALSWKIALSLNFAKVKSPFALLFIYMRHRANLHFFDLLLHPLPCSFSVQPNALYCLYVHSFKFGYFFLNFYNAKTPGKTMTFLSKYQAVWPCTVFATTYSFFYSFPESCLLLFVCLCWQLKSCHLHKWK